MKLPVDYTKLKHWEKRPVREAYIAQQKGKCYYCDGDLDKAPISPKTKRKIKTSLFPDGFFNYPVHLHHDHHTRMTLGAVHCDCNAILWQYEVE